MWLLISGVFIVSSSFIIWYFTRSNFLILIKNLNEKITNYENQISLKDEVIKNLNDQKSESIKTLANQESENKYLKIKLEEQKKELSELNERIKLEFKNLANAILEEKSKKFVDQNKSNLELILKPFQQEIKDFKLKVEETNKESISRHASLSTVIQKLNESSMQISKEAEGLTKALKGDTKIQGDWGEFILESILEKSGLIKDQEYFLQKTFRNEEDNKLSRPDIIVKLPDDKHIIVDSKVSLVDYVKYINSDNEQEKLIHIQNHLNSVKNHIKNLSIKNYQNLYNIRSLDFVLMFIPIESSFSVSLQHDINLFNKAMENNIVLTSPATLMATLKTIKYTWKAEYQNRNVQEIARQGGALYDKFVGFTEDLINIGKQLDKTQSVYQDASKKLYMGRDNLVNKTQRLKELGANSTKILSQVLLEKAEN